MKLRWTVLLSVLTCADVSAWSHEPQRYRINPNVEYQTVDGFGASDAWSMRFVGEMDDETTSRCADWLFSMDNESDGKPKGIGLSIWRFNIGAGSVEQGDNSQIGSGTRTECFLSSDGSYDWTKQAGQRKFMRLAKERGVPCFLGFLNSPPVYFTQNGLATNTGRVGASYNLKEDRYDDFARFMADVIEGLDRHDGIKLDYISPLNEPDGHWNWQGPKQEGTPATNREIARVAFTLDKELTRRGLDTRIIIPESSDYRCMFSTHMTGWDRANEIRTFFSPDSVETFVGSLRHLPHLMAGHSYWSNTPVEAMKYNRIALNDTLRKYGVDFWQSEVCIMSNDDEIGGGNGFDRTMKTALYVARLLHHDMVYANARSWQWWRAIGGDYKDGLLFQYRERSTGNDTIVDSKLLWTLGNYSRFIRPGAKRVDISKVGEDGTSLDDSATNPYGLMLSAYKNEDGSMVVVAINYSETDETVCIGTGADYKQTDVWDCYVTSDSPDFSLAHVTVNDSVLTLPARSVTTFVKHQLSADMACLLK